MPTPFLGMDPYLEYLGLWEEVQTRLIVAIADTLGPQLRPHYRVSVERRTYLAVLTPDEYRFAGKDLPIPLQPGETEPLLPLNQLLHDLYDRAGYDLAVDYGQPPEPPLAKADMAWLSPLLQPHVIGDKGDEK